MNRLSFLFGFIFLTFSLFSQKISVGNISVISGEYNNPEFLFDGNTKTGWFAGWDANKYPAQLLIDFDHEVNLNKIRYYDGNGSTILRLLQYNDTKKNFVILQSYRLDKYQTWVNQSFPTIKTRYIVVEYQDIQGDLPITELEFYYDGDNVVQPPKKVTGDALKLGTNGFHWVSTNLIPTPNIRVYQQSQWTWTKDGLAVEPTRQANGNYDSYYRELKNLGITVVPCINQVPDWFKQTSNPKWPDGKFNDPNTDPTKPEAYRSFSQYAWQLSARYGKAKFSEDKLRVNRVPRWTGDPINQPLSGLDLLDYLELENEPDRPWNDPEFKYTPQEFAAMVSALADGHEGKLGEGCGIANGSKIKLVIAGLSSINVGYLHKCNEWMKLNRQSGRWPDNVVFQFHHYCNIKNNLANPDINLFQGYGIEPERDNLGFRLKSAVQYIRQNIGNNEIWFGEFGYDTTPCTTLLCQYPDASLNESPQFLQSQWNLRTFLIAIESGIDKSFVYNLSDEPSSATGYCFGSSGLLENEANEFKKKESWKSLKWLVTELDGYKFYKRHISQGEFTVLEFRNGMKSKFFYWKHYKDGKPLVPFTINKTVHYVEYEVQMVKVNRSIFNSQPDVKFPSPK